jgi:acetoin utilization protein AcuB
MRAADRMRREPIAVVAAESLGHGARVLARHRLGAVPVVRRDALVGLLDAADVARAHPSAATSLAIGEIHGRLDQVRLDRIVRPDPPAVGRRTPLSAAVRLMRIHRLAALPVIQGDRLVGLLTDDDLLELLAALLDGDPPPSRPRAA